MWSGVSSCACAVCSLLDSTCVLGAVCWTGCAVCWTGCVVCWTGCAGCAGLLLMIDPGRSSWSRSSCIWSCHVITLKLCCAHSDVSHSQVVVEIVDYWSIGVTGVTESLEVLVGRGCNWGCCLLRVRSWQHAAPAPAAVKHKNNAP